MINKKTITILMLISFVVIVSGCTAQQTETKTTGAAASGFNAEINKINELGIEFNETDSIMSDMDEVIDSLAMYYGE